MVVFMQPANKQVHRRIGVKRIFVGGAFGTPTSWPVELMNSK